MVATPDVQISRQAARGIAEMMPRPDVTPTMIGGMAAGDRAVFEDARKAFASGQVEQALHTIAGDIIPYSQQDTERTIITKLSTARDADGRKANPTDAREITRVNTARAEVERVRQFLEQGIINPATADQLVNYMRTNNPIMREVLDSLPNAGARRAYMERYIRESQTFKAEAMQLFKDRLAPGKGPDSEADVIRLRQQVADLTAELAASPATTATALTQARARLTTTENKLAAAASQKAQLDQARQRLASIQGQYALSEQIVNGMGTNMDFAQVEQMITTAQSALSTELGAATPDTSKITKLQNQILNLQKTPAFVEVKNAQKVVAERNGLVSTISNLETTITPLETDLANRKSRVSQIEEEMSQGLNPKDRLKKQSELDVARQQLADAQDRLDAEMISMHRDITHIAQDAMTTAINGSLEDAKGKYLEKAREQAEKDKTEKERIALVAQDKLANIWKRRHRDYGRFGLGRRWLGATTLSTLRPDLNRTTSRMNVLLTAGKDGLLRNIEAVPDTELMGRGIGMTQAEVTAFRDNLKDSKFRTDLSDRLSGELATDYLLSGGNFNQGVVRAIAGSPIGVEFIRNGISKAEQVLSLYPDLQADLAHIRSLEGTNHFMAELSQSRYARIASILAALGILAIGPATAVHAAAIGATTAGPPLLKHLFVSKLGVTT